MKEDKLERCGFCGRWFTGDKFIDLEGIKERSDAELNSAPLGYCPEAQQEDYEQNPPPYEPTIQEMAEAGIISLDSQGNPM